MRIDRLATICAASLRNRCSISAVPVLMYHSISDEDHSNSSAYYRTTTSPRMFAEHMSYLREHGYSTTKLGDLKARSCQCPHERSLFAITFDDGYEDFYSRAFPILEKYGFSATVFLPTAFVGNNRRKFNNRDCMTWKEVRELKDCGIAFGSHTVTHPQLHDLHLDRIREELTTSKQSIEQELGSPVESFAYPFAFPVTDTSFVARLRECLLMAGYRNGVCTSIGRVDEHDDPLFMKRLPVNSYDDLRFFEAKLSGAYDWVAVPQRWTKLAKAWARALRNPGQQN